MYCPVQFPTDDGGYVALHYQCHQAEIDEWPDVMQAKFKENQMLILRGLTEDQKA